MTKLIAPSALVNALVTGLVRLLFTTVERSEVIAPDMISFFVAFIFLQICYP